MSFEPFQPTPGEIEASTRLVRAMWRLTWLLLASWTPPPMRRWRRFLLVLFGARMGYRADARRTARVWLPRHLTMGDYAVLADGVRCQNEYPVDIGRRAIVSQRASLYAAAIPGACESGGPIRIGAYAWVAAEAFVGAGVTVGEGALLGARGVCTIDLEPWLIYAGDPVRLVRARAKAILEGDLAQQAAGQR